jgi:hypothetical protein
MIALSLAMSAVFQPIGADARRDREQVMVDRFLHDGRRQVHVARRHDDLGALADQLVGAGLRRRRGVLLRVAGLEHDLPAADTLLVDLLELELRRRERR